MEICITAYVVGWLLATGWHFRFLRSIPTMFTVVVAVPRTTANSEQM